MVVIRPGLGVVHPAVLLILLAALLFSLSQISSRVVAGIDPILTIVAYTALAASICLRIPLPFVWQWPTSSTELALLISMAILAAVAEITMIKALDVADDVVLAPVHYSIIIWATLYGFVIFDQLPDIWTWVGASIIRRKLKLQQPPTTHASIFVVGYTQSNQQGERNNEYRQSNTHRLDPYYAVFIWPCVCQIFNI